MPYTLLLYILEQRNAPIIIIFSSFISQFWAFPFFSLTTAHKRQNILNAVYLYPVLHVHNIGNSSYSELGYNKVLVIKNNIMPKIIGFYWNWIFSKNCGQSEHILMLQLACYVLTLWSQQVLICGALLFS